MKKVGVNTGIGLVFLVLGVFWESLIMELPDAHRFASFGPDFFPEIIVICMIVISVLLIVTDVMNKNKTSTFHIDSQSAVRLFLAILLSALYIFLLPTAGYLATTIPALFLLLLLFGLRKKVTLVLLSVLVPVGLYLLFEVVLKVLLP
jgi:putative tricarboxylic transport membrane protein